MANDARTVHLYPNRKQALFLESSTRHTAYGGARGGGKSWVVRVKAVMDAGTYGAPDKWSEGIKICIVRRTLQDLMKNHLTPLKMMIGDTATYNSNDKRFNFKNGATIQLAYCDNDNDADHFQGIEYDEIFIEEATQLKSEWIVKIATSCRGVNDFPHRVFYTCNPGGPGHGMIKRLFVDRLFKDDEKPEDYSFIQAKVTDNRVLMEYSPEYVTFLKNLPPKIRSAWLDGSWDIYQGQYFELVNDPDHYEDGLWTHVINPIKIRKHWTIYRGLDWGFFRPFSVSRRPFCAPGMYMHVLLNITFRIIAGIPANTEQADFQLNSKKILTFPFSYISSHNIPFPFTFLNSQVRFYKTFLY